jgi:protein transport protein YIF1
MMQQPFQPNAYPQQRPRPVRPAANPNPPVNYNQTPQRPPESPTSQYQQQPASSQAYPVYNYAPQNYSQSYGQPYVPPSQPAYQQPAQQTYQQPAHPAFHPTQTYQPAQQPFQPTTQSSFQAQNFQQKPAQQQQPFQPQQGQQPQSFNNYVTDFQQSAAGQLGMQLGTQAFAQAQQQVNQNMGQWINIQQLRYYFNVSNSYVFNKLRLLLFPFRHKVPGLIAVMVTSPAA